MAVVPGPLHNLLLNHLDRDTKLAFPHQASFVSHAASIGSHIRHLVPQGTPLQYFIYSTLLIFCFFPFYHSIISDYHDFLSLGPGGTPSTFSGYLWVTFLKLVFARKDIYVPPAMTPNDYPNKGFLSSIPRRKAPRPSVAGIAPHRQITQKGTPEMLAGLTKAIYDLQAANKGLLSTGVSCFEKNNLALFFSPQSRPSSSPQAKHLPPGDRPVPGILRPRLEFINALNPFAAPSEPSKMLTSTPVNPTCGHPAEITHLHTTESSMHLTLHPLDAALVIENGWGERHPLAGRGPWVPRGFVMVYAPSSKEDLQILVKIIKAGAWWVGGCVLNELEAQ